MKVPPSSPSLFAAEPPQDAAVLAARLALPAREGHYDALRGGPGAVTGGAFAPHWLTFFNRLGADGLGELDRNAEAVARQMRENGVTYNVYADPEGGGARPWSLDLLPQILTPADWAAIEAGISQRASLLNAVLDDVYGARTLLSDGLLPPALVLGHPGYLRALHGYAPPGGVHLHIAAFDLARATDGGWWVVSQRTQAPSGLGYMLENRLTISRLFPAAFRELRIEHLAAGYRALLANLDAHAPVDPNPDGSRPAARIVLLTPGPYNETYFEHAYLARYLGITLVEGSDLMVRDERLYLKTLYGLERVHAVLRRLDDDFCDPLELRADSHLGITGLLQAIRAGNVLMANALGSSFLESPGINGFLPALCQHLTGVPLALPSLPSWWCGEAAARDAIAPRLASLVIKPTYPSSAALGPEAHFEPVLCGRLLPEQLEAWRARINARPDAHTVQAYIPLAQTPTWSGGRIVPRASMVRVFAIATTGPDGRPTWRVLPGGLTRVAARNRQVVSMQSGGVSQDTWVMSAGAPDTSTNIPPRLRPEDLARKRRPVSSRAAENLFWMGRYSERADNSVRLARISLLQLTGDAETSPAYLQLLARICRRMGLTNADVPSPVQARRIFERALVAGLAESGAGGAVAQSLEALARAAGPIRDRLSSEHWRLIRGAAADFEANLAPSPEGGTWSSLRALTALERLAILIAALTGAQSDRMTRDAGWRLLTLGRQIERLVTMAAVVQEACPVLASEDGEVFKLLLDAFDSTITYRAHYQGRLELPAVIDLLVQDGDNPRSLACCTTRVRTEAMGLPAKPGLPALQGFLPDPATWDLRALIEPGAGGRYPALERLVTQLINGAWALSDELGERYFAHVNEHERAVLR